jgi:hypothetical protein
MLAIAMGKACAEDRDGASNRRKLYVWSDAFSALQAVQRLQQGSPRFDLCDLASAAVKVLLKSPDAVAQIDRQARNDFVARQTYGFDQEAL